MTILVVWVLFSIIVGVYAENHRNRNGLAWFLISFLCQPIVWLPIMCCDAAAA